jgi:hypothetical protein
VTTSRNEDARVAYPDATMTFASFATSLRNRLDEVKAFR